MYPKLYEIFNKLYKWINKFNSLKNGICFLFVNHIRFYCLQFIFFYNYIELILLFSTNIVFFSIWFIKIHKVGPTVRGNKPPSVIESSSVNRKLLLAYHLILIPKIYTEGKVHLNTSIFKSNMTEGKYLVTK